MRPGGFGGPMSGGPGGGSFGGPGRPMGRPPGGGPGRPGGPGGQPPLPMEHGAKKTVAELDLKELEKQSEEMMTLQFLTSASAQFTETSGGFLSLTYGGKTWERVQIVRTFPFSNKDSFLSVRECTETAKEIGIIRELYEDFPKETVSLIEKALNQRYFMPVIEKIYSIKERSGYIYFQVKTEKGQQEFTVRNNSNAIIPFTESRLFITDVDNNRYEIPDTSALNPKELTKLDLYL